MNLIVNYFILTIYELFPICFILINIIQFIFVYLVLSNLYGKKESSFPFRFPGKTKAPNSQPISCKLTLWIPIFTFAEVKDNRLSFFVFPVRLSIINITQVKSFENGHLVDIWWTFWVFIPFFSVDCSVTFFDNLSILPFLLFHCFQK